MKKVIPTLESVDPQTVPPVAPAGPEVDTEVSTRCLAGKVLLTVKVTSAETEPVAVRIQTAFGSKTLTLAAGKASAHAFTTRMANVEPTTVTVTATDGDDVSVTEEVSVGARSCS